MIVNSNSVLTVKTADSLNFENACNDLVTMGYDIRFSGHNGDEWWAVLVKPEVVKRNRAKKNKGDAENDN